MSAGRYVHRAAVYELVVNGRSIHDVVERRRLKSLSLTEKRGNDADVLEIVLCDKDGRLDIPPPGAIITLKMGWLDLDGSAAPLLIDKGSFKVDERSHSGTPDQLTISAKSADLTRAFRSRRTQTWTNTTLGDVLAEVAARNALQAHVAPAKAEIAVTHLNQSRESDSAFLARLGRLHDAVATVKSGRLIFAPIGSGETASGAQIPTTTITRRDGDGHSWKAAERGRYSGVTAEWHDRSTGDRRSVTVGGSDNAERLGRTYGSEAAARRAAEAQLGKRDRKGAEFSLSLASGRPDLYPERKVTVSGFKPEIDSADWLITETTHRIDGSGGMRTSLSAELGSRPS